MSAAPTLRPSSAAPGEPVPPVRDLLERFREAAARHPERDAVVAADGTVLGFGALAGRVRELAAVLGGAGIRAGEYVGVAADRGPELVVALLAVWQAGAAYVPLDPAHPRARLAAVTEDTGLRVVIDPDAGRAASWPGGVRVLTPGTAGPLGAGTDANDANDATDAPPPAGAPAYVIHTSGSTGRPKGVVVSRDAVAHLVAALERSGAYPDRPARVAWNASLSFDASVQQWARICRGDTLLLLTESLRADPAALAAHLLRLRATDLDATPSHWSLLAEPVSGAAGGLPDGLRLFLGGEAVPAPMWRDLADLGARSVVRALNLYGPTECTVDATAGPIDGTEPHIGRPLPGVGAHVLDDRLDPADEGELYLTGPGLALGYLRRPALTAERFCASPFGPPGTRMYRTGDRVRRRADGALDYLGRVDQQVKLNGFRIELGEIEAVLTEHPAVAAAVVALREHPAAGRSLAAYWVPAPEAGADPEPLRRHLAERLPAHLTRLSLTVLETLPLGPSGKVDRAALPAPAEQAAAEPSGEDEDAAPTGELETLIAVAWQDVLGRERVLATDDFFALGGHSLVALRVVADLRKQRGTVIPTRLVYQNPRLRDLARAIAERTAAS
ncbi:amino acid adenylation domain-containing protein [Kitasatospora sp. NPDC101157]|uniref:non-ribosomal peptide synthetase n=1 Tax=Kitasatospora sp. NPDC101157 TaxID=3364098 RepID=UPI0037FF4C72